MKKMKELSLKHTESFMNASRRETEADDELKLSSAQDERT